MPFIIEKDLSAAESFSKARKRRIIILHFLLVLIVAVSVRLWWGVYFPVYKQSSDAVAYHDLAKGLLETGKFGVSKPHSFWPPLWPYVLYLKFLVFGDDYLSNLLFILILNMIALALLFQLSLLLFPNDLKCAIISGYLYALYPNYISLSNLLVTENLFNLLFLAFILLILTGIKKESLLYFVLAGIFLGFCNLCRGSTVALPFFLLIIRVFKRRFLPVRTFFLLALLISSLLVTSVWTVRNYITFKMFILINTNSGQAFYLANNPLPILDWAPPDHPVFADVRGLETEQAYKVEMAKAFKFIAHNPFLIVLRWPYKIGRVLMPGEYFSVFAPRVPIRMGGYLPVHLGFTYLSWYIVLVGSIIWLIMRIKLARRGETAQKPLGEGHVSTTDIFYKFLLLVILYWFLFHCFFLGTARHRYPLESILFIFAVKGFRWLKE